MKQPCGLRHTVDKWFNYCGCYGVFGEFRDEELQRETKRFEEAKDTGELRGITLNILDMINKRIVPTPYAPRIKAFEDAIKRYNEKEKKLSLRKH